VSCWIIDHLLYSPVTLAFDKQETLLVPILKMLRIIQHLTETHRKIRVLRHDRTLGLATLFFDLQLHICRFLSVDQVLLLLQTCSSWWKTTQTERMCRQLVLWTFGPVTDRVDQCFGFNDQTTFVQRWRVLWSTQRRIHMNNPVVEYKPQCYYQHVAGIFKNEQLVTRNGNFFGIKSNKYTRELSLVSRGCSRHWTTHITDRHDSFISETFETSVQNRGIVIASQEPILKLWETLTHTHDAENQCPRKCDCSTVFAASLSHCYECNVLIADPFTDTTVDVNVAENECTKMITVKFGIHRRNGQTKNLEFNGLYPFVEHKG
jgi:hypothetical protein